MSLAIWRLARRCCHFSFRAHHPLSHPANLSRRRSPSLWRTNLKQQFPLALKWKMAKNSKSQQRKAGRRANDIDNDSIVLLWGFAFSEKMEKSLNIFNVFTFFIVYLRAKWNSSWFLLSGGSWKSFWQIFQIFIARKWGIIVIYGGGPGHVAWKYAIKMDFNWFWLHSAVKVIDCTRI